MLVKLSPKGEDEQGKVVNSDIAVLRSVRPLANVIDGALKYIKYLFLRQKLKYLREVKILLCYFFDPNRPF
jgi:hypothetical protein